VCVQEKQAVTSFGVMLIWQVRQCCRALLPEGRKQQLRQHAAIVTHYLYLGSPALNVRADVAHPSSLAVRGEGRGAGAGAHAGAAVAQCSCYRLQQLHKQHNLSVHATPVIAVPWVPVCCLPVRLQFFGLRSKDHYAQTVFFYGKVRIHSACAGGKGGRWPSECGRVAAHRA
jgi:hypothetical protein